MSDHDNVRNKLLNYVETYNHHNHSGLFAIGLGLVCIAISLEKIIEVVKK